MKLLVTLMVILAATFIECRKIRVGIYYETECPGCRQHILNSLVPAKQSIGEYMDIEMVPYGNARVYHDNIICQHGQRECEGNAIHACVLDMFSFEQAFNFIICTFESADYLNPPVAARQCAQTMRMNFEEIHSCAYGTRGHELSLEMGRRTPSHNYVPWTTIEGQGPITADIKEYICQNYLSNVPACYERE